MKACIGPVVSRCFQLCSPCISTFHSCLTIGPLRLFISFFYRAPGMDVGFTFHKTLLQSQLHSKWYVQSLSTQVGTVSGFIPILHRVPYCADWEYIFSQRIIISNDFLIQEVTYLNAYRLLRKYWGQQSLPSR